MKLTSIFWLPLALAGFALPDDRCSTPKTKTMQLDGPYVWYNNDLVYTAYIVNNDGEVKLEKDSFPLSTRKDLTLKINTDKDGKQFKVRLKESIEPEKSNFPHANKQLVISDIEGNFSAFRNLLQSNGVIDENFNWTFGEGHLVLIGDFVDRGEQVTEVLWLIYSLEDKAKKAGGYVHYVLGNHEIMIMSYDTRYVNPKYKEAESRIGLYSQLYGPNSELGRWLRSKNIMEKVGDRLYMHAGVSQVVNSLSLPLDSINMKAKPFYDDTSFVYPDQASLLLYESQSSPFWYRGYYAGAPRATQAQVDSTLALYSVGQIVTGHTVIDKKISAWYNDRVVNIDVRHSLGDSEALLIEDKNVYRVNQRGEKIKL
jgi:hypothetical protein